MAERSVSWPQLIGSGMFNLFLVFLVLKLTETIDWSWWWVLAPLWIPWAFAGVLFVLAFFAGMMIRRSSTWTQAQARAKLMARPKDDEI